MAREKQKICPICNEKLTFWKSTLKGGVKVCEKHVSREANLYLVKDIRESTVEDIKERIATLKLTREEFQKKVDSFHITKQIGNFLAIDDENERWAILNQSSGEMLTIYNYDDLVDFELLEDGNSVASGGLGRALVGGALFGGAGAIVGGITGKRKNNEYCDSLKIKLTINNIDTPVTYLYFITSNTKKSDFSYSHLMGEAQECVSIFQLICEKNTAKGTSNSNASPFDEVRAFKELLDEGIITEDEFEAKKKKLLGI